MSARLAFAGGLAAAVATLLSCAPPSADLPSERAIRRALETAARRGPGTTVSFDILVTGEWRHLYVFGPYTPDSLVERCVGAPVNTRGISGRDDAHLLVLAPERGPTTSVAVRRAPDFGEDATGRAYPRGAATFAVRAAGGDSGEARVEMVPASGVTRSCAAVVAQQGS